MSLGEPVWAAAVAALRDADEVALACHVGPDGDALGSMLALGLVLDGLGKRVVASWGSRPFTVPEQYAYLPGQRLLVDPDAFPAAPPLLVTFDTGSAARLGTLEPVAAGAGAVLVVDHHATNTGFGTVDLVDPDAAASAVLVAELVDRLGVAYDEAVATCLYTGLTTDTGSFKFVSTTPAVHHLAARLLATGVRHDEIARRVWDTKRFGYLTLLGTLLGRATLEPGLVWTWVSAADMAAHEVGLEDVEGVIDVLRTAEEADVALVCKQAPDGAWLASMRSRGGTDVGAVAVALGGGGHRYAAGFTSPYDLDGTVAAVRAALA